MTGLYAAITFTSGALPRALLCCLLAASALLCATAAGAAAMDPETELQALANERDMLTAELDQYRSTVKLLHTDGTPPEQSTNPAVRKLAQEMVSIKERLIKVTERELTVLQQQITAARQLAGTAAPEQPAVVAKEAVAKIESKPLRSMARDYSRENEQERVERLHTLLAGYYAELQEAARTLPTEEELAARAAAREDAEGLSKMPFSADKVRLDGAEGSTALSQITSRLTDPNIPESRRDVAPICGIRTHLFGSLIASERRSLQPVGKNNYVARIRLQPGDTTLQIKDHRWDIHIPQHLNASDFLVTLYAPGDGPPELHLFAIDDLMAEENPYIPAWMPDDIRLNAHSG
jgi:hypothetical protein